MAASVPRQSPAKVVARPRLMRSLARPWKVAVLAAPAGFGKTTLAAQLASGRDALWCRLGPEDRDPAHLLDRLLLAAARTRQPFGVRTRRLFEARRDMERDGAVLTASFLDELAPARGRRLVVLDDAHALVDAREGLLWLRRVIEESGPRVSFLIACRGECPLPLARLDLHGGTLVLRAPDLEFTSDERARLLGGASRAGPDSSARAELLAAVGGWPAGVVLAARHLRHDPDPRPPRRARAPRTGAAGDERRLAGALEYLAEEVFSPLPPALQATLCRAALLEDLDVEALGILVGRARATELLAEIERRDLFMERPPAGAAARLHPLFREFLLGRLATRMGDDERRRLSGRLARHWMRRGEAARAIRVLADAGALEQAVRLFDEAAERPRGQSLGPVALELARGATAGAGAALSPGVLLHGAYQALDARHFDETLRLARDAQAGFMRQRAFLAAARAFRLEGATALIAGRLRDSRVQGEALLRALPARARAARGTVALHLGPLHLYMGEPARARTVLHEAARWLRGGGHEIEEAECSLAQATVAYTEGHWDVYLTFARRALPIFRRAGYRSRAGNTLINMGEACTYLGLEDVALAHFDEAEALLPRWSGQPDDPHLLIYRARAFAEKGELDEAARRFVAAREPIRRTGHPTQRFELDVWEGICARRRGRLVDAGASLARAAAGFAGMELTSWVALARMERALVLGLQRHTDKALSELRAAARVTRRLGDEKELARNALFEARVRQIAGGAWRAPLRRALLAFARLDYLVLLRKEADVSAPLLAAALDAPPLRALAARCLVALPDALRARIERGRGDAARAGPARVRSRPPERVRRRARDAIAPGHTASGPVRVRLLGAFEVRLGDRAVSFSRRAAEALVACLALRRGAAVRRETLAEWLWPDAAVASSRNRFDVALNAARHALEPGVLARGPFRVLTTEGGLCRLAPGGLDIDVDDFERKAHACEPDLARSASAPWATGQVPARADARGALDRLEAALGAYGGELLPALPDAAWAESERERLRDRHHRLLLGSAQVSLALARPERTVEAARQVLAADPLHEEALRLLLRALAARGERAAALRSYQEFARRLADELDTTPSPETTALSRELTSGK